MKFIFEGRPTDLKAGDLIIYDTRNQSICIKRSCENLFISEKNRDIFEVGDMTINQFEEIALLIASAGGFKIQKMNGKLNPNPCYQIAK